jgi:hypothetical protein
VPAVRQGWTLPENDALEVFKLDIELDAQGLESVAGFAQQRERGAFSL